MRRRRHFVNSLSDKAGYLILANLIKYAVGFVMPMVLVRMLSQSDYGAYQQMIFIGWAALSIMTLGLPTSIYYFYHYVSPERIPTLVVQTSLMLGIGGAMAAAAVFFGAPAIADILNNPSIADLLKLYAVSIVFMIASEHSVHFMIAQNRYGLSLAFETGETFIRVLVLLLPLWFGFGFSGLIVGIVLYAALRFVVRTAYLFSTADLRFAGWSRHLFTMEQLGYSIPIALVAVVGIVGSTFNKGILATSFTAAEYALYSVGALEIPLDVIFQASVANVLRASLPPLVRDGNLTEVVRVLRESVRKLSIIVLPSFVFLYGYSEQFITVLFTADYAESVHVFRIYLWLVPLNMLILSPIPQIFGKPRLNLYINLSATAVLLALSYALFKGIGFYGPVIAAVASQYLAVLIFIVVALRLTRSTIRQLLPLPSILLVIAASLVGLVSAQIAREVTSSGLLNLLLAGVVFSAVFLVVAALIGVLTKDDRSLIRRWIARILPFRGS